MAAFNSEDAQFICSSDDMYTGDEDVDYCASPIPVYADRQVTQRLQASPSIVGKTSQALQTAIQSELKQMVEEPLSHATLNQISRFANIAQELIMVRSPIADVRQRKRKRGGIINYTSSPNPNNFVMGATGSPLEENALTGEAAENETFATKLIRELVSAVGKIKDANVKQHDDPIDELVKAVAAAKQEGLDELASDLEQKLHERLADKFLKAADGKDASADSGPVPKDKSLVGPVKPVNGTAQANQGGIAP